MSHFDHGFDNGVLIRKDPDCAAGTMHALADGLHVNPYDWAALDDVQMGEALAWYRQVRRHHSWPQSRTA